MLKELKDFSSEILLDLKPGNNDQTLSVYVKTISQGKQNSQITNLPNYDSIESISLYFEGFDCINITAQNIETLSGNIFLMVTRGQNVENVLIASPVICLSNRKSLFNNHKKSVNSNLKELRASLFQEWNESFSDSYDELHTQSVTLISKPDPKPLGLPSIPFRLKEYLPRNKLINGLIISILVLTVGFLGMTVYSKSIHLSAQKTAVKSLDAAALAKQQDEQLNEAFLELGIDRSKLTSDLSCFVE